MTMSYGINTRCIYGEEREQGDEKHYGALSYPIYQTATFQHPQVGVSSGYDYSRLSNPTRNQLESVVASLEKGTHAYAFSSGMAAITVAMEIFSQGAHIIAGDDLYGGSVRLFDNISRKNGYEVEYVDTSREDVEKYIRPETKAVYIETPTNPMMNVTDIAKAAEITKKHGILLIVDNTFLSPYLQNPLELGADIVIHSGTKFLCGHNDTLSGFVVVKDEALAERILYVSKTTGANLSPFDSWLVLRGIKTLGIRMERQQANAAKLAEWLKANPKVKRVYYPGFENHPGHNIMKKQARGFGSMISFEMESKESAVKVLNSVKLISFAESLGGVETLLTYPTLQTHPDVPAEVKERNGITESLLRLSVGIEDIEDLIADLEKAFA